MSTAKIGVIGGSGVYQIETLADVEQVRVETPFGDPSDDFIVGTLAGTRVAFLPRHGRGHRLMPTEVNSRANIWGFKTLGVESIISISACGSLREDYAPGDIVIPDQLFDHTKLRHLHTFFGRGLVAHIGLADPFCPDLSAALYDAVQETGATVHRGGTLIVIEGPRFSTKGESRIYRQWGCDIIGMTAVPEAQLAREAEICYAIMAHVTDYDVWHETEEPVTIEAIVRILQANAETAKQAIRNIIPLLPDRQCACVTALHDALFTQREYIPAEVREELDLLVGAYLK
ncbi:MAG: S-methyl-5'-thioadenosine phosphorylase [Chloroflexi bacterium]|nr:S-methyl-5'-thioadenosine phosphorylase [Chloroflexota bacterium]MBU1750643.1 S-methyl-5'-thioadenosine phosphorylase [Chloroflexota bacterium]MBU1877463.1 S-methyl-5'-thioadenosine phosphorylase [Chloroflexota bacterium]